MSDQSLPPAAIQALLTQGDAPLDTQRYAEALAFYRQARVADPANVRALSSEGTALLRLNQLDEALAAFDAALRIAPHVPGTWYNRGLTYAAQNRIVEGLADFSKAIEVGPDFALAHINRGMLLLLSGDYHAGFAEFEWRFRIDPGARELRHYRQPRWRKGDAVKGKRVLLYAEQGMGDVIQFARFVPQLAADAAQVVLEVQPALVRLMQATWSDITDVATGRSNLDFNLHSPLISLGHVLEVQPKSIPAQVPYLRATPDDVARWRSRLAQFDGRRKIGLVWSGNPQHNNDPNRSLSLSALVPLFDLPGTAVVGLQKDIRQSDHAALQAAPLFNAGAELTDLADTAALIEALDLVISADTSVAHLAGALGKPVWVLLPFAPDWRWMLGRSDSPWYPTATLFRQPRPGDWPSVIREVRGRLASKA